MHISIHALREEGDLFRNGCFQNHPLYFYPRPPRGGRHFRRMMMLRDHEISIHALREEGDTSRLTFFLQASKFLSTPSARRATALHPPESASNGISIHALREEGDGPVGAIVGASTAFLSTPSARRATQGMYKADLLLFVFLSTPSARRATAKTEKNISAFVSL